MRWAALAAAWAAAFSLQKGIHFDEAEAQVENEKAQTKVNDAVKLLRRAQHQTEKAGKLIGVFDAPTPPPPLVSQDFPLDQVIARAVDGAVAARLASQTPPPPVPVANANATNATAGAVAAPTTAATPYMTTVAPSLPAA